MILLLNLLTIPKLSASDDGNTQIPTAIITGVVFNDKDGDGEKDDGEEGLAKIPISDGLTCIPTDSEGHYRFETNLEKSHFIFVITPTGYKNSTNFYQRILPEIKEWTANFGISPFPESKNPHFSFVQISDIHVDGESKTFIDDLNEILPLKPAFIIATGDLVTDKREFYEFYKEAIESSPIPIYSVIGNHDMPVKNYKDFLGPTYYSFNYGGRHFVILNCMSDISTQLDWLKNDIALQPKNVEMLVFHHYPPDEGLLNSLSQYNTKAIFTGHWHSSKVFQWKDILYVNTPPLRFGGIDMSPRGFRVVSFQDGDLILNNHFSGCKGHLAIVSPGDGSHIPAGKIKIKANIYDVSSKASKVEYQIDKRVWKEMLQVSKWTWEREEEEKFLGDHILKVSVSLDSGVVLQKQVTFKIIKDKFPTPDPGSDWPMFQHDSARTGNSPDLVSPPLYLAWSTPTEGTIHISSPVIAHETVYIGVQDEEMRGKAGVYALDAKTGKIKWRYKTGASVKNTVVVFNGFVYAMSVDGKVYALDTKTGKERWNYSLGSGVERWVYSSPVVSDNVIYLGVAPNFVALDANTGEKLWQAKSMGGEGGDWISCYSSPAIGEGKVYAGFNWSNGLFALNRSDGNQIWNKKEGFIMSYATPAFFKSLLYYPADGKLHAMKADTGEELWSFPLPGGRTMSSPAISGSKLYLGSANGKIFAIDSSTGKMVWEYQTGKAILFFSPYLRDASPVISSPALSGNVVYVGSTDGKLYALDTESGKELWSYNLGVPITSSPAISGNTVYIAGYDGSIYAFTTVKSRGF